MSQNKNIQDAGIVHSCTYFMESTYLIIQLQNKLLLVRCTRYIFVSHYSNSDIAERCRMRRDKSTIGRILYFFRESNNKVSPGT